MFPVRCCFSALHGGLRALVAWLLRHGVTAAVLEATGIYWETPCEVLEGADILPLLVHAQYFRQIRGCKTDVADSVWLARVCQFGLCKPSLVPLTGFRSLCLDLSATPLGRAQPGAAPYPHSGSAIDPVTLQPQVWSAPLPVSG